MDRPTQMDREYWKPDRVVFFKRPVYRAMIAATVANEIVERMIKNEVKRLPKQG